jgi:hypothetical protein
MIFKNRAPEIVLGQIYLETSAFADGLDVFVNTEFKI